jgi:hypothetical protein
MADEANDKGASVSAKAVLDAEAQALRDKTARLRALREAHEAANPAVVRQRAAPRSSTPSRPAGRSKKSAAKSVPLSDWLNAQEDSGRRK